VSGSVTSAEFSTGTVPRCVTTHSTLEFLLGTWEVSRTIEDHKIRTRGSFVGGAVVSELPTESCDVTPQASYTELGVLSFGTYRTDGRRQLKLRQSTTSTVVLYFSDGRPFTDLDLSAGAWRSTHLCAEDRYDISTIVRTHDLVEERWNVRGPTKNYDAVTTLKRIGGYR
jgi:hypothetical protein